LRSKIILSDDLDRTLSQVIDKLKGQRIVTPYERDEFLIDDAKSVIHEAYLTSDTIKYLILKANKFNLASQNTLLKILEEPPENIIFIIITKHKASLLPTVRSRLPIEVDGDFSEIIDISMDIKKLDLQTIYNFIQKNKRIHKDDARVFIQSLLVRQLESNRLLSLESLELFDQGFKLLNLNSNPQTVLLNLLLGIYVHEII
jgi:DNA polymerase-3 subunit delta'